MDFLFCETREPTSGFLTAKATGDDTACHFQSTQLIMWRCNLTLSIFYPSVPSLPLNSARASFFSLIFSSSFFRCRSTITLFRKLIWRGQIRHTSPFVGTDADITYNVLTVLPVPQQTPSPPSAAPELHHLQKPEIQQHLSKHIYCVNHFQNWCEISSTWGCRLLVSPLWGLRSHEPLLQTVNTTLQLSFVSLQRLHSRLQGLGHGVLPSKNLNLHREQNR